MLFSRPARAALVLLTASLPACAAKLTQEQQKAAELQQRLLEECRSESAIKLFSVGHAGPACLAPEASGKEPPPVPNSDECTDPSVRFRLYPDGRIQFTPPAKGQPVDWALCLKSPGYTSSGEPADPWQSGVLVRITKQGGYVEDYPRSSEGGAAKVLGAGAVIKLPTPDVGVVKVEVFAPFSDPKPSDIDAAFDEVERDAAILSKARRMTDPQLRCDPTALVNAALRKVAPEKVRKLIISTTLPTASNLGQFLWVDGSGGVDGKGNNMRARYQLDDQTQARIWGFNIPTDGSQILAVVKGTTVVQSSSVGTLLLWGLSAGIGSPFSVSPGPGQPPPTPTAPSASASPSPAPPSGPPLAISPPWPDGCGEEKAMARLVTFVAAEVNERLRAKAKATQTADFTALVTFIQVDGGYNYVAQVRDATALPPPDPNGARSPTFDVNPSEPVLGSVAFQSRKKHRIASVALEEAWNVDNGYPASGYNYVPIAQSGPDQLYQMQQVTHPADRFTLSTLAVVYPVPLFGTRGDACLLRDFPCFSGVALGFGPTILRGANAEVFKQWNARVGWEILPTLLPDVVLTAGISWREMDVPNSPSDVNTVVSVPKPASTPGFATHPQYEVVFSTGLSIDLAVVTDAVGAVAASVSGSSKGAGK